jgi:hypothetical protein
LEEFAQHALTGSVSVDAVVDELLKLAKDTGMLAQVPAPWNALIADVGSPVLKIALRWLVKSVERKLGRAS